MSSPTLDVRQESVARRPGSEASVILLTYNGSKYLRQTLEMLGRQQSPPREIIAIDSGSSDDTTVILAAAGVQLHQIPNSEFSHSKTRNLAAQLATGKYVVFLTQDATPADSCWLSQLLLPFQKDDRVAGVYSRQIPRPDANPMEANDIQTGFPPQRKVKSLPPDGFTRKNIWQLIHFSNVSSAYGRQLLLDNPFCEDLAMAEDQEWAMRMLRHGHTIAYEPDSIALHSHQFSLRERAYRDRCMGMAFARFLSPLLGRRRFPLFESLYHTCTDTSYMFRHNRTSLRWLLHSPFYRAASHYAYWRGWNSVSR